MRSEAEDDVGSILFSRMLTELVRILMHLVISLMLNDPLFNPRAAAEMP